MARTTQTTRRSGNRIMNLLRSVPRMGGGVGRRVRNMVGNLGRRGRMNLQDRRGLDQRGGRYERQQHVRELGGRQGGRDIGRSREIGRGSRDPFVNRRRS